MIRCALSAPAKAGAQFRYIGRNPIPVIDFAPIEA